MLEIRNLSYSYPHTGKPALAGVSLKAERGQILGLLSNTNPPQPIYGDNNGTPGGTYVTVVSKANYPHPLSGPGVIHQSLPNRGRLAARSANPGLARQHLVHTQMLGRGLSR